MVEDLLKCAFFALLFPYLAMTGSSEDSESVGSSNSLLDAPFSTADSAPLDDFAKPNRPSMKTHTDLSDEESFSLSSPVHFVPRHSLDKKPHSLHHLKFERLKTRDGIDFETSSTRSCKRNRSRKRRSSMECFDFYGKKSRKEIRGFQ